MSGGKFDYISYKVDEVAPYVEDVVLRDLVFDVARLLHDLEWYKSGDTCQGEYREAEMAFRNKWFPFNPYPNISRCSKCQYFTLSDINNYGNCRFCEGYLKHRSDDVCVHYKEKK